MTRRKMAERPQNSNRPSLTSLYGFVDEIVDRRMEGTDPRSCKKQKEDERSEARDEPGRQQTARGQEETQTDYNRR